MSLQMKRRAEQQAVFSIINAIIQRAHWILCIPEIVLEFMQVQFTETNPKLSKMWWADWVVNTKPDFAGGGGFSRVAFS